MMARRTRLEHECTVAPVLSLTPLLHQHGALYRAYTRRVFKLCGPEGASFVHIRSATESPSPSDTTTTGQPQRQHHQSRLHPSRPLPRPCAEQPPISSARCCPHLTSIVGGRSDGALQMGEHHVEHHVEHQVEHQAEQCCTNISLLHVQRVTTRCHWLHILRAHRQQAPRLALQKLRRLQQRVRGVLLLQKRVRQCREYTNDHWQRRAPQQHIQC